MEYIKKQMGIFKPEFAAFAKLVYDYDQQHLGEGPEGEYAIKRIKRAMKSAQILKKLDFCIEAIPRWCDFQLSLLETAPDDEAMVALKEIGEIRRYGARLKSRLPELKKMVYTANSTVGLWRFFNVIDRFPYHSDVIFLQGTKRMWELAFDSLT